VEGALAAASLRQLLRASLKVLSDPEKALSECRCIAHQPDFDAAVMKLDTNTGTMISAATGRAGVEVVAQSDSCRGNMLSTGAIVWVAAGDVPMPISLDIPFDDLDQFVRNTVERKGSGCATALLFRARDRPADSETFVLTNDSRAITPLLGQVTTFFDRHSIAEKDVEGVDVAIDEVLTNAISHAFGDGNAHEILVTLTIERRRLVIEIRDDGTPFNPLRVPPADLGYDVDLRPVGGLGLHFVRTVMDATAYERSGGWNVLTLYKRLEQAPA
jgi:anti-sigma regulatory factor (Ser/Thr protein kinase)